jgi:hypothetical protein
MLTEVIQNMPIGELTGDRQRAINVATATAVVRSAYEHSKTSKLPWLRANPLAGDTQARGRNLNDKGLAVRHTVGIIDAVRAKSEMGQDGYRDGLASWGRRAHVLSRDVEEVIKPDEIRTGIEAEAAGWTKDDIRRREREAHGLASQLPKGLRGEFYQYAGLEPEGLKQKLGRWAFTAAANATTTFIPLETAAAGATIAGVSPMHKLQTDLLWGAVITTEAAWLSRLNKAATKSNDLLEKHDRGSKMWAKGLYNWAVRHKASRRGRRTAGWIGYAGGQIVAEIQWVAAAYTAHKAGFPLNETLTTFTGLNIGAAVGEEINARLTQKANEGMSK